MNDVHQFVFRALLARQAVADLRASGILRTPTQTVEEQRHHDLLAPVQETVRAGAFHMQRAFRLLYVLENIVRELISSKLTEEFTDTWFDVKATTEMKRRYQDRKSKEDSQQWHPGRNRHPIFYLDFGDLSKLIVNNWPSFEAYFPSQAWVQSRLDEAERSRNVIAHTNLLPEDEVDRLEMYLRDFIRQVG
jgi:hypothetical protein